MTKHKKPDREMKGLGLLCIKCGALVPKNLCPECGSWNTSSANRLTMVTLDQVEAEKVDRLQLNDNWGFCFGGGIAIGTTTLIGGFPGAGKSTLFLHLVAEILEDPKVLYIATEEKLLRIKQRANRLEVPIARQKKTDMVRMTTGEVPDLSEAVKTHKVLMLDSLNMLTENPDTAVAFMKTLSGLCERTGITCIVSSHVTKGGDLAGFEALQHVVDCTMMFSPDESQPGTPRILDVTKNRNGRAFISQTYAMEEKGLVLIDQDGEIDEEEED